VHLGSFNKMTRKKCSPKNATTYSHPHILDFIVSGLLILMEGSSKFLQHLYATSGELSGKRRPAYWSRCNPLRIVLEEQRPKYRSTSVFPPSRPSNPRDPAEKKRAAMAETGIVGTQNVGLEASTGRGWRTKATELCRSISWMTSLDTSGQGD